MIFRYFYCISIFVLKRQIYIVEIAYTIAILSRFIHSRLILMYPNIYCLQFFSTNFSEWKVYIYLHSIISTVVYSTHAGKTWCFISNKIDFEISNISIVGMNERINISNWIYWFNSLWLFLASGKISYTGKLVCW